MDELPQVFNMLLVTNVSRCGWSPSRTDSSQTCPGKKDFGGKPGERYYVREVVANAARAILVGDLKMFAYDLALILPSRGRWEV